MLALCALAPPARALNVHAVYRTACDRDLGVILAVERRAIHLLRLDGTTVKIPRHEIASLAYYPVSQLPVSQLDAAEVPLLRVETFYQGRVVELATGWPIDYSESKVSLLLPSGKDLVLDRNSIWSLEFAEPLSAPQRRPVAGAKVVFVHPQAAGFCAQDEAQQDSRRVFAQQILNDKIVIKRELDRLEEGYHQVVDSAEDQKFYPVPQLYRNRTSLGLWASVGSRYGASENRPNNYTPMLIDERSFGPFRYQHRVLTGVAPSEMLLHPEAQAQLYYRFKVAYFHAAVFLDPNLILVGSNYLWRPEDLASETLDDRISELGGVELGFDLGPVALEIAPAMVAHAAVKTSRFFDRKEAVNLWRGGARFTQRAWELKLTVGRATASGYTTGVSYEDTFDGRADWKYLYGRLNLLLQPGDAWSLLLSTIVRTLDYDVTLSPTGPGVPPMDLAYTSLSATLAAQGSFAIGRRFRAGGQLVLEYQRRRGPTETADQARLLPNGGVFTSFSF